MTRATYPYPPDAMAAIVNARDNAIDPRRMAEVRWAVSRLEPHLRLVAEARFMDGLSSRETADRLGVTRWEVWRRERQAGEFLRSELAGGA
jgi:DNA-directed RNA polymerase specialized sigma24 family protein